MMASNYAKKVIYCAQKIGLHVEYADSYQDPERPWSEPDIRGIRKPRMLQGECVSVFLPGKDGTPVLWFRYITVLNKCRVKGTTDQLRAGLSDVPGMSEVKIDWFTRQLSLDLASLVGKKDWERLTGRPAEDDPVYRGKQCSYKESRKHFQITASMLGW